MTNVSLVGFGRIGRDLFRQTLGDKDINIVSISDTADKKNLIYLLKYDSIYGKLNAEIHETETGIVVDGRDITTVIFPDAEIKFYITASLKDRANRRFEELVLNNPKIDKKLVIKELQKRDQRDMERSTAPLKIAKDAIVIDTTDLSIEEVNSIVQREIKKVIK